MLGRDSPRPYLRNRGWNPRRGKISHDSDFEGLRIEVEKLRAENAQMREELARARRIKKSQGVPFSEVIDDINRSSTGDKLPVNLAVALFNWHAKYADHIANKVKTKEGYSADDWASLAAKLRAKAESFSDVIDVVAVPNNLLPRADLLVAASRH